MNTLLAQEIHDKALACGYDDCGIVPLDALDFYKERMIKRLEDVPESKKVYAHSNFNIERKLSLGTIYSGLY